MMTSSNGNIFRVTGPLCGEFTGPGEFPTQRPVTRSFDVFFDLRPNKRLSKQWRGWWFETLSRPFWRHRNGFRCILSDNMSASMFSCFLCGGWGKGIPNVTMVDGFFHWLFYGLHTHWPIDSLFKSLFSLTSCKTWKLWLLSRKSQ